MSKQDDGGPAFPGNREQNESGVWFNGWPGMSLRDWFAGQALAGLLANENDGAIVKQAYLFADAMLAARSTPPA